MQYIILLFALVILISSCAEVSNNELINESKNTIDECGSDSDCSTGGCSGQICGKKDKVEGIITTCEWQQQYDCLKLTSCGCVNGKCQWEKTDAYLACWDNLR